MITEYQVQVLEGAKGKRFVGKFLKGYHNPIQYGASIKADAVYLSKYQLLPYKFIEEFFAE